LGNTLKELGRLEDAEASYSKAIAIKPDYAETHSNLGLILQELGRLEDAVGKLQQSGCDQARLAEAHAEAIATWATR
jgi:tetratricopeptide (TPR) repeat protein